MVALLIRVIGHMDIGLVHTFVVWYIQEADESKTSVLSAGTSINGSNVLMVDTFDFKLTVFCISPKQNTSLLKVCAILCAI